MSGNKNFNKTKENKPKMKTKSHKFDYLKTELKYLDVKVAELLVSDFFGHVLGTGERNDFLDREFCVPS